MINSTPNTMTITTRYDWQGTQYTNFNSRVEWVKRNFLNITIIVDTNTTFQFSARQNDLTTILEVTENDRDIEIVVRFS